MEWTNCNQRAVRGGILLRESHPLIDEGRWSCGTTVRLEASWVGGPLGRWDLRRWRVFSFLLLAGRSTGSQGRDRSPMWPIWVK